MTTNTENCEERRKPYDRTRLWGLLALLALLLLCCLLGPTLIPGVVPTATPVAQAPTSAPATQAPIAAPTVNADVKDGALTLTGTGTPGSKLQIVIDGQPAGEVTVGPDGKWTFNTNLEAGDYKIEVNALDAGGNVAASAPALTVNVPAALAAPEIEAPTETTAGPVNFVLSGTPNSDFQIMADGKVVSTGKFGADGKATVTTELAAGPHTIEVNALDAGGNVVASAEPLAFTLGEKAAGPTISDVGGEVAGPVTFNGTGTPGATVQIVVDGQPVGEAEVGPDGTWSFTTDLTAGPHKVEANELGADGNAIASAEPVDLTLGESPSTAKTPTLDLPSGALYTGQQTLTGTGTPGSKVQIVIGGAPVGEATVGADGKWSFEAEFPSAGEVPVVVNELDAAGKVVASSDTATLKFSALTLDALAASYAPGPVTLGGSGIPGSKVQITVDGQPVGEAEVGADGKWSFPYNFTQAGNFNVAVNGLDANGQVVASTPPATARIKAPVADVKSICDFSDPTVFGEDKGKFWLVDRCDTLTYISRRTNIALAALIAANPQVKNPDLIYPGWEITLPGR
jgi:hypothetical protein